MVLTELATQGHRWSWPRQISAVAIIPAQQGSQTWTAGPFMSKFIESLFFCLKPSTEHLTHIVQHAKYLVGVEARREVVVCLLVLTTSYSPGPGSLR
jgi:hypothetical protein